MLKHFVQHVNVYMSIPCLNVESMKTLNIGELNLNLSFTYVNMLGYNKYKVHS